MQLPTHLSRLNILQNKMMRVIFGLKRRESAKPFLSLYKIPNVKQINFIQTAVTLHKVLNSDAHPLRNTFSFNYTNHTYGTRQQNHLTIPKHRTNIKKHTLSLRGPSTWNSLPLNIQQIKSTHLFKKKVKQYILSL